MDGISCLNQKVLASPLPEVPPGLAVSLFTGNLMRTGEGEHRYFPDFIASTDIMQWRHRNES